MSEPTVDEVLKLNDQALVKETKKTSKLAATFWFFAFPPWGCYLMWKDKDLHAFFALISLLSGVFYFFNGLFLGAVGLGSMVILILCTVEIAFSLYFWFSVRKTGCLENYQLIALTALAVVIPVTLFIASTISFGSIFEKQIQIYQIPGL